MHGRKITLCVLASIIFDQRLWKGNGRVLSHILYYVKLNWIVFMNNGWG